MTNDRNNAEIPQLISNYFPYWPYFMGTLILCMIAAALYIRYVTPVYKITAAILIKNDNTNNNDNNNSKFLASLDLFSSTKIVENEIEIIHSRRMMDTVVKQLGLYAAVYRTGRIHNMSAYITSPVSIRLKYPDSLKETKQNIFFIYNHDDKAVAFGNHHYPINSWVRSPWGIIKFISNPNYVSTNTAENEKLYFTLNNVHKTADNLLKTLDIEQSSKISTVIVLTLKDPVPKRGEDILNELIHYYVLEGLRDKNELAANSLTFLDGRLNIVEAGLDSIENLLQFYKSNKGAVDLGEQSKLVLGSLETIDQKISGINGQLAVLNEIGNYVKENTDNPGLIVSSADMNDVILSNYLNSLYNAEIEYDKLIKTTAQNNPILLSLKTQINKIKPTILQYINSKTHALETNKINLNTTISKYSSTIRSIPLKEHELLEISRQQSIKNKLYTYLLQKKEEAALSYSASVSDVRIIDNPQSGIKPDTPKKSIAFGIACLLGLCLPIVILKPTKKIVSMNEISEILDFPILGHVSNTNKNKDVFNDDDERGFTKEQFRQVRTSLSSIIKAKDQKRVLITSSIANEGKSFIASNLAFNLALAGRKTVIIDLDLRKPDISNLFNVNQKPGVSDFLNQLVDANEIIYNTNKNDNLYLIPAGTSPSNPSELLLNGRMAGLLDYLEDTFDFIILETAPLELFTDGYIVSKICDVTIFVIRYMVTPKSNLIALKRNFKLKSLKKPVIVFNGVKGGALSNYDYKYYGYIRKKYKSEHMTI